MTNDGHSVRWYFKMGYPDVKEISDVKNKLNEMVLLVEFNDYYLGCLCEDYLCIVGVIYGN